MANQWFRLYHSTLDDPKVQRLSGDQFKAWVNILCLACRNDGVLPGIDDIAFALRESADSAADLIRALKEKGLLDDSSGELAPHNWSGRQFSSDADATAADRKRRQRQKQAPEVVTRDASVTSRVTDRDGHANVTRTEQNRTDTEQTQNGTEKKARTVARIGRPAGVDEQVWSDFQAQRKTQRAPITDTVIKGIEREAFAAGFTLNDALRTCCERGWRGFKADWVANGNMIDPAGRVSSAALKSMHNLREYLE